MGARGVPWSTRGSRRRRENCQKRRRDGRGRQGTGERETSASTAPSANRRERQPRLDGRGSVACPVDRLRRGPAGGQRSSSWTDAVPAQEERPGYGATMRRDRPRKAKTRQRANCRTRLYGFRDVWTEATVSGRRTCYFLEFCDRAPVSNQSVGMHARRPAPVTDAGGTSLTEANARGPGPAHSLSNSVLPEHSAPTSPIPLPKSPLGGFLRESDTVRAAYYCHLPAWRSRGTQRNGRRAGLAVTRSVKYGDSLTRFAYTGLRCRLWPELRGNYIENE
ncbi:hypothetical protein CURE108131_19535 [Cupriavidus respiraculi]|uniref:Uncharacterized protein n=1 Tax=Cupriavidus respiraculi TaxID=195930 RepID=A0ABN7Z5W1_9BURK|nr:hypothetical protein LMG21510_04274 [Cupriavidus respiraculi]